ncbi:variable surface protein [Plasmodium gonderi]|uniref:Variable surface protein n=1 Tax=Plasmodium gonderi TaxID=77519 RepID=A0A1Y1JQY7_PLAGO|nr:variable surface protein [Plasmodium gonderi]GAW83908.1 variable surface protein [Plasmodium gonderi]
MEDNFDYENIFPQCSDNFTEATTESFTAGATKIQSACQLIYFMIEANSKMWIPFINECKILSHYLIYINNNSSNDGKNCCNYFNYRLKQLLRQYNCDIQNTLTSYEQMIKAYTLYNLSKYDICWEHVKNLEDDSFFNISFLEWLYFYLADYKRKENKRSFTCPRNSFDYKEYLKLLSECETKKNKNFCRIIYKLQDENSDYMLFICKCLEDAKPLAITSETNTIRLAVATFIVLCTILITVLIFYRFNFFGLYLQRTLRKIRSHLNNKNNDNYILNDIFEMEYTGLIKDEYKIEYTSKGY